MASSELEKTLHHLKSVEEIYAEFSTGPQGLQYSQIEGARNVHGWNELRAEEKTPLWKLILEQFEDLLVRILLGAAVLSFVIALFEEGKEAGIMAFVEPLVILLILILNAAVGVWQESNAENALEALKKLQPTNAKVFREGKMDANLPARELVPGDLVEVRVGDKVPADIRVVKLKTTTLRVNESALTGESRTILKQTETLRDEHASVAGKINMVFSGTTIDGGAALGVVVSTGMKTEIGKIQQAVSEAEEEKTPLKIKLEEFGELLTKVIGCICVLVWVMNYKHFLDPIHGNVFRGCIYYLKIAVALGVAAIPEGLPAVITLCLALGTRRMVKKNAIIRKLPSVETLGCTTVICSDKTGTLTLNEMTAVSVCHLGPMVDGDSGVEVIECQVEGTSYNPRGLVKGFERAPGGDHPLVDMAMIASNCNEATIQYDANEKKYNRVGEPTEAALSVLVEKLGVAETLKPTDPVAACHAANDYYKSRFLKVAVLEFSRGRKSMSVVGKCRDTNMLLCKGAPENVLPRCTRMRLGNGEIVPMSIKAREQILETVRDMASRPLRTLAFAFNDKLAEPLLSYDGESSHPAHKLLEVDPDKYEDVEQFLVFSGLVGIKDPARPEVKGAIAEAKTAGIRVIMITGDNKETAESIAREIGIFGADEDVSHKSFLGRVFMALPKEQQIKYLMEGGGGRVFSRTDPRDKQALVILLKEQNEIAAMTGDGVNDAPALKSASIGIAMGITGTEVAKEASCMILADDNFATIVHAVEEGRAIYNNMKAFIRYLISSNIGEVACIFLTAALGVPEGMVPVQLLWVNLVTDGPPATALGFNKADPDIMTRPPRRRDERLITPWVFFRYLVIGVYVGIATVGIFVYWYLYYENGDGHSLVSWKELSNFAQCPTWTNFRPNDFGGFSFKEDPCSYFTEGKLYASTLSLTVLVVIEMFNALNALSEDSSLLTVTPFSNPYLLLAIVASMTIHCLIMYIPIFAKIFGLVPLTLADWKLVVLFSFPVTVLDEVLKFVSRIRRRVLESSIKASTKLKAQ